MKLKTFFSTLHTAKLFDQNRWFSLIWGTHFECSQFVYNADRSQAQLYRLCKFYAFQCNLLRYMDNSLFIDQQNTHWFNKWLSFASTFTSHFSVVFVVVVICTFVILSAIFLCYSMEFHQGNNLTINEYL